MATPQKARLAMTNSNSLRISQKVYCVKYMRENNSDKTIDLLHFLKSGLDKLKLKSAKGVPEKIIAYVTLLNKWNKIHNLTSISDPKAILTRHIFDSLAITSFIKGPDILDFGTGAGLPGIPLALLLPEYNFSLLDSSHKKTIFLRHVVLALNIKNVEIITKRIEEFNLDRLFTTIVTRATAKLDVIVEKTENLCVKHGQLIIMKGKNPAKELKFIKNPFELYRIEVPCLNEERHVVKILI
jgi:16S rRNA (guanine527-N7)-methyltransferase